MKFKKFTLLFVFVLSAVMLKAQDPKEFKTWNLNLEGGVAKAYTDVRRYNFNPAFGDHSDLGYYFGLGLKKSLTPVFGIQGKFNVGKVQGALVDDDIENDNRLQALGLAGSHYSEATTYSGSLNLVVNFSNIGFFTRNTAKPRKWLFYGQAGYGFLGYDAEIRTWSDVLVDPNTNTFVSQDNEDIEGNINGGLGVKYKLSSNIDLGFEVNYHVATTDFLDAISVPNSGTDRYTSSVITLNYKLPAKNGATEHLDWAMPGSKLIEDVEANTKGLDSLNNVVAEHINNSDTDGDGVPDANDKEPYSLFGAEVDADGVAKDTDGDGVPDGLDKEPDTPKGELVNFQGVAIGDQIKGGNEPQITKQDVTNMINDANNAYFPSVFFATNSSQVRSAAMTNLVAVATAMQKNSNLKISLTGHADKRGSEAYNNALANRRAEAVKNYLVRNLGVDASRITVNAKGETAPMSSTIYSVNRRVDISGN